MPKPVAPSPEPVDWAPSSAPANGATLQNQALATIRRDVLVGKLAPNTKLVIRDLQESYALSSSPLREALSKLSQEGLVTSDERRGFRVAPISVVDMADITHMRLLLDVPALAEAMRLGDDLWEAAIVSAFHRLDKLESTLSGSATILDENWGKVHRDFHLALLAACASERQKELSASLFDQAERYRRFSARSRQSVRRKGDEHRRIMAAALRRNSETACALLADHIRTTQRNVEDSLKRAASARLQ